MSPRSIEDKWRGIPALLFRIGNVLAFLALFITSFTYIVGVVLDKPVSIGDLLVGEIYMLIVFFLYRSMTEYGEKVVWMKHGFGGFIGAFVLLAIIHYLRGLLDPSRYLVPDFRSFGMFVWDTLTSYAILFAGIALALGLAINGLEILGIKTGVLGGPRHPRPRPRHQPAPKPMYRSKGFQPGSPPRNLGVFISRELSGQLQPRPRPPSRQPDRGMGSSVVVYTAGVSRRVDPSVFVGKIIGLEFKPPIIHQVRIRGFRIGGYEIRGLIGRGGSAVSLLAVDEFGRSFVLKIPLDVYDSMVVGATVYPGSVRRDVFEKELALLKIVDHPHVVRVYGGGIESGVPYIVLEYCENGSLRGVLGEMGRLGLRETLLIGLQVADALQYLHSRNIIHRDLKPENILFTREGLLKISDFGIAKIVSSSMTTTRLKPYTIGYGAPEQLFMDMGPTGPYTDIWSLGVILYELATGRKPFNPANYIDEIRKAPPPLTPLPRPLRDLVGEMLEPMPRSRPAAAKIREELARILSQQTI